jgi:hypothetical protein
MSKRIPAAVQVEGARRFLRLQQGLRRESVSGPGSTMNATSEVRTWLPQVLHHLRVRVLADIPCGDYNWMASVDLPCDYRGYDVLVELIEANRQNYPWRATAFEVLNAVEQIPKAADVILCRDLLVHLDLDDAQSVIENFKASGSPYVILTTFPGQPNHELAQSYPGWGWRPLDMEAPPFNKVLKPMTLVGDVSFGVREIVAGEKWERWLKLYSLT